jgi:hypothetical protein
MFACQVLQVRQLKPNLSGSAPAPLARIVAGDFNLVPTSPLLQIMRDGNFKDAWKLADKAECEPRTGDNCTSGRDDTSLAVLKDPTKLDNVRVDYVWAKGSAGCKIDAQPKGTGLFAGTPAVNGPNGLAWISDHVGVLALLRCV